MEDWGTPTDLVASTEDFLADPPKGWEILSKEMLEEMFPGENVPCASQVQVK